VRIKARKCCEVARSRLADGSNLSEKLPKAA
jgi:hypothetical protein